MADVDYKPIAWMVSNGGIPITLVFDRGHWFVLRPMQTMPPSIDLNPERNEQLQYLDGFLKEAEQEFGLTVNPPKGAA